LASAANLRASVVLVVSAAEQFLAELSSGLGGAGCTVLRARSGREAIEHVGRAEPDTVVIDADLPDMSDLELCRRLRREPRIGSATAILLTSALLPPRDRRLAALEAGGWEILPVPIDIEELLLKVRSYTEAKMLGQTTQAESLVDPETGLYNVQGLARRADELGALAMRAHGSLACVVLAPEADADTPPHVLAACCAKAIKTGTRHSDVGGRLGTTEFAVLAPGIDEKGAARLAQRLADLARTLAREAGAAPRGLRLHSGCQAVGNLAYEPVSATALLARARRASAVL
jgi:PleD family two-component response regulator